MLKETLWLNAGSREGTSVLVEDKTTITTLLDRYKLDVDSEGYNEISLLAGAQFLVFGKFRRAQTTGKCIIFPEIEFNANAICFRKMPKYRATINLSG